MVFKISDKELREVARVEEEADCDVEAGFDWGPNTAAYLRHTQSYIDREKLLALLQEGLAPLLDADDIDAIAIESQNHTKALVTKKLQATETA